MTFIRDPMATTVALPRCEPLFNEIQICMEKMHTSFGAKESTVLTFITVILYFCAILSFAYLFTMS
jgi:hypothetical protein